MSDPEFLPPTRPEDSGEKQSQGPSLVLLYSIVALALAAAIAFAAMIVWPFYRRR
ncbi:MAG: hypothetical protein WBC92_08690 [Terracidiphilus sp.]